MFDTLSDSLAKVDDSALVEQMTAGARLEAQAAAARWSAIAELVYRRVHNQGDRQWWACDGWAACGAEVGAALTLSTHQARTQMSIALALRERLPLLGALLAAGRIGAHAASTITWRTRLVEDHDVLALLDTALAGAVLEWGSLSKEALIAAIDGWVHQFDPAAVIQTRRDARSRAIEFGKPDDDAGTCSIWGALLRTDAAILEQQLNAIAGTVCSADPRTVGQRRADALGVLGAKEDRLACLCANPECPAARTDARAAAVVVIHVLTDTTPQLQADPALHGEHEVALGTTPASTPLPRPITAAGYLPGGHMIPPNLLADLVARGATVRPLASVELLGTVERYRPTAAMTRFVQMRYLTCTFPGCTVPAVHCDIDHSIPWPAGPTHPGNLDPKCRTHHLLKTFWPGWSDHQHPDGTIEWTAPTGHHYRTTPLPRILFPDRTIDTPLPSTTPPPETKPARHLMMPRRRHPRTHDDDARIAQERRLNQQALGDPPPP